MEQSVERLLSDLQKARILIHSDALSIKTLTPQVLFSVCAQCVNSIVGSESFPLSLPERLAEKVIVCGEMSLAVRKLGFIGDMSVDKFLYPSEEDMRELIRFLAGKLFNGSSVAREAVGAKNLGPEMKEDIFRSSFHEWTQESENHRGSVRQLKAEEKLEKRGLTSEKHESFCTTTTERGQGAAEDHDYESMKNCPQTVDSAIIAAPPELQFLETRRKNSVFGLSPKEEDLMEEATSESMALAHLQSGLELLKAAIEMTLDGESSTDSILENLQEQVDDKRKKLLESDLQWNALKATLNEKKRCLEESLYGTRPECEEKFQKLKQTGLELDAIMNEVQKKDCEYLDLSNELKKQQKRESRRSYVQRIEEITKNSRKQHTDVERILKETRELQLESNAIQERLHRTFAVLDETVFREAKKDRVGRQAYRLLTSIHESFEQISDKILSSDRVRREIAQYEKKLVAMATRSINMETLRADVDAIRKENEHLTQCLETQK